MKRIIAVIILSFCFGGYVAAQDLQVVSAVENGWIGGPGKVLPKNVHAKYIYHTYYTITLGCNNFKSIVLDSIYMGSIASRLIVNDNVKVDSLNNMFTISVTPSDPTNGNPSGSGRETERRTIGANFIVYKYKRKKYILPIKVITDHVYKPC